MERIIVLLAITLLSTFGNLKAHAIEPQKEDIVDIIADIVFIATDVVEICATGGASGWASLGADIGCAFIPGATGGGNVIRGVKAAKNVRRGSRAYNSARRVEKFYFYKKPPKIFLDGGASMKMWKNKNILPSFNFSVIKENLEHAVKSHGSNSSYRKSKFLNSTTKEDFLNIFQEGLEKINRGADYKVLVSTVRGKYSYTFLIDMGRQVGTRKSETMLRFHWNPGFLGNETKHCFSMFPCTKGNANTLLTRQKIEHLF